MLAVPGRPITALYSSQTLFLKRDQEAQVYLVSGGTEGTAQTSWDKYQRNRQHDPKPVIHSASFHRTTARRKKPGITFLTGVHAAGSPAQARHGVGRAAPTVLLGDPGPRPVPSCSLEGHSQAFSRHSLCPRRHGE